jgi:hypothetical protein
MRTRTPPVPIDVRTTHRKSPQITSSVSLHRSNLMDFVPFILSRVAVTFRDSHAHGFQASRDTSVATR